MATTIVACPLSSVLNGSTWIASIRIGPGQTHRRLVRSASRANRSQGLTSALPTIPYFHPRPSAACKFAVPKCLSIFLLARGCLFRRKRILPAKAPVVHVLFEHNHIGLATGCVRPSRMSRASAGGQLAHPRSEQFTRTGVERQKAAALSQVLIQRAATGLAGSRTIKARNTMIAANTATAPVRKLMPHLRGIAALTGVRKQQALG